LADDAGPATDPSTDPTTAKTEDLRLTFIGFGKGFVFNGAGPNVGETPNEKSAGTGVDALLTLPPGASPTSIAGADTILSTLFPLSGHTLLSALDQLGGAQLAAGFNLMSGSPIFTSDSVQTVLWARGGGGNTLASARLGRDGMQVASAGQVLTDAGEQTAQLPMGGPSAGHISVWGRGYGVFTNVDNQTTPNVVPGFKENRYGGIVGADYSFNDNWLVGVVGNYSHDTADFKLGAGNTKVNSYLFGLYGQYRQGPWYVNAIGSGGWSDYTSNRNLSFPLPPLTAHSSYSGQNWGVYAEGGWDLPVNNFKLTPFIGLGYLHQNIDQFTETGAAPFNLTLKGDNDSLQTSLGLRASTTFQVGSGWLTPELRAIWEHEFMDQQQTTTDAFAINPGAQFQIRGPMLSRETGVIGGGLTYTINPSAKVFVDYDFRANSDFTSHQVSAGVKWTFGAPPPPPPPPAPPPVPAAQPAPPPPAQAQTFVVYFDFDKSALTPEAMGIIKQAAAAYKQTGAVNLKVDGYTDLAGTAQYNIGLSKRRADVVRAELVKDGVPNNAVAEAWHGKDNPAVPTPDGVREPRNRRATIMLP
jgi:outer membrane autotransporter protein